MITAVTTAKRLDWRGWGLGIMGAIISGGAGAIATGGAGLWIGGQDPDHYLLQTSHILTLMGVTFLFSAIVSLAKYLQTHPVPEQENQAP